MTNQRVIATCPQCQTQFYASAEQLSIAKGQVRCGTCLNVFSVTENESNIMDDVGNKLPATKIDVLASADRSITANLATESIELNTVSAKTSVPIVKRVLFALSTSALVLLLAFQVLWFMKGAWLQDESLRAIYSPLYSLIGAELPPRQDIDLIATGQLAIQPHETYKDAIRVSILLENKAGYDQPFPAILFSFEDIKGRMVSQRKLIPSDYIDGSVFPDSLMPSHRSVQIQLDFMAPGRRASGYQIQLLAAPSSSG